MTIIGTDRLGVHVYRDLPFEEPSTFALLVYVALANVELWADIQTFTEQCS